jgi:hypothetical protein
VTNKEATVTVEEAHKKLVEKAELYERLTGMSLFSLPQQVIPKDSLCLLAGAVVEPEEGKKKKAKFLVDFEKKAWDAESTALPQLDTDPTTTSLYSKVRLLPLHTVF